MPTDFESLVVSLEVPDAVVILTPDGKVMHWTKGAKWHFMETPLIVLANSQVEKLFGYFSDERRGKSVELLLPDRFKSVDVHTISGNRRTASSALD